MAHAGSPTGWYGPRVLGRHPRDGPDARRRLARSRSPRPRSSREATSTVPDCLGRRGPCPGRLDGPSGAFAFNDGCGGIGARRHQDPVAEPSPRRPQDWGRSRSARRTGLRGPTTLVRSGRPRTILPKVTSARTRSSAGRTAARRLDRGMARSAQAHGRRANCAQRVVS